MGIEMNQHLTEQTRVYLAFADADKAREITTALHKEYLCFAYRDIHAMQQAVSLQAADMLICEQSLLDAHQADALIALKRSSVLLSMALVGSSSTNTGGSINNARATATLCR